MLGFMLRSLIGILLLLFAIQTHAQIVILTAETPSAVEFANDVAKKLNGQQVAINPSKYGDSDTVITVGNTPLQNVANKKQIALATYVSFDSFAKLQIDNRPQHVIYSDPSPGALKEAIEKHFPNRSIGYIRSGGEDQYLDLLEKAGVKLTTYPLSANDIYKTLSAIYRADQPDLMLVSENRDIYNQDTILFVLESLYRNRIPVIATNKALINKGSTLTVFTTKETIAERTAAVVLAIVSGAGAQSEIFPEAEVQVDRNLADKLNIAVRGK